MNSSVRKPHHWTIGALISKSGWQEVEAEAEDVSFKYSLANNNIVWHFVIRNG